MLNFCCKGLNKSAIIQKISLAEAEAVSTKRNATGQVKVHVVDSNPVVLNPNGELCQGFLFVLSIYEGR